MKCRKGIIKYHLISYIIGIITRIRQQGHEHIHAGVIFILRELKYSNKYTYA